MPSAPSTTYAGDMIATLSDSLQKNIEGEVRFDAYSRMLYSTDASPYQIRPVGVVIPKTVADVQVVVELARKNNVPVLPRGGGTSLNGQSIGPAIAIDFSKYMDRILHVDREAMTVNVQPGITVDTLNHALRPTGYMLGPDPASASRATIGGCIGNNATGSHSILYGMMADNVQSVELFLSDASHVSFDALDLAEITRKARHESLEGRIYRQVPDIVRDVLGDILTRWPKHWRRASGYNLDRLAAPLLDPQDRLRLQGDSRFRPAAVDFSRLDRFNLAQLITGSEGTLGIVTAATLHMVPRPKQTALAVLQFDTLLEACAIIPHILECAPSAVELMDRHLIELARSQPAWAAKMDFIHGNPEAILITEFYGDHERVLQNKLAHLQTHLQQGPSTFSMSTVLDPALQQRVWSVRKAGLDLLMSQRSRFKPVPGIEDVSVPPEHLADYVESMLKVCGNKGIDHVVVYAHASAGCLHVRPLLDLHTETGVELMVELTSEACDLALEFGGVLSGEHGDGINRSAFNPRLFGPALYKAMVRIKQTFDPQNLLNPGKVVNALPPTKNLRYGSNHRPIELHTTFNWQGDGGYLSAIEMCNGSGVCRKLKSGAMCPSYMATRDEHDTTRGRANALRNALTGHMPLQELYSPEMYDVLDLCLGCKACKSECPSSVDLAKIKAEFLVHYYHENGLPLFNRLMGMLPALNAWLFRVKPLIPLVNRTLRATFVKRMMKYIGIHPNRTLPQYASDSFVHWFKRKNHDLRANGASRRPVILFHDTWTNYNEPHIGQALTRVLHAAGYQPIIINELKCCGRPLITGGQADKARANVDHNLQQLHRYALQKIPIVGVEPSCMLTLRDEYLTLATDSQKAREVAAQVFTVEEFVKHESEAGRFNVKWRSEAGRILLHSHCHQKSLVGEESTVRVLEMAGYDVEVIPSGCCGMAGDFGYGINHYEVSQAIAEDRLLPALRASKPGALIVSSGTSCRQQIHHFSEREPLHLAEALDRAIQRKG